MRRIDPARRRNLRVALYSHDTQGLGHVRRNSALAAALVRAQPGVDVLLLSGSPHAGAFRAHPQVQLLTLPAVRKSLDGTYAARGEAAALEDVIAVRTEVLAAALACFDPDVLIVDKVPRGFGGELEPALSLLRARGRARIVLGVRDVLDSPTAARLEWARDEATDAIDAFYDEVWVYGDRAVYDPIAEYGWPPDVARKTRFAGYLARRHRSARVRPIRGAAPFALCIVGGGQDGYPLAEAFLRTPLPDGWEGVVVAGPEMPAGEREALDRFTGPGRHLRTFVDGCEHLLADAAAVVSMAGYNSVCEILASRVPALLVPRVRPRLEQYVRAERLARRGWVTMLDPDDLCPEAVAAFLASGSTRPAPHPEIDLDGLARFPRLVTELVRPQVSHAV